MSGEYQVGVYEVGNITVHPGKNIVRIEYPNNTKQYLLPADMLKRVDKITQTTYIYEK
ncbi:hypothetical protein KY332_00110 [Candidatus Woesearchaeota archaeon]|nr:hypothetical protein [Candidatus Woesearchaeota archaeon]